MSKLKKLAQQTAIYGLSSIVGRFLNYLLVPLYTYNLPPEEYGVVTELYTYVSFLIIVLTYGMETGFFRFSGNSENIKEVYKTSLSSLLTSSSVFIIFILLFYDKIAGAMNYQAHPEYILWFGIIIALDAFSTIPFARLRKENKAMRFAIIKIINILTNVGLNLFFIKLCPELLKHNPDSWVNLFHNGQISVKYIFISNLVSSAVTIILLTPQILDTPLGINKKLLKKMLKYSLPLLIAGLAGMVNETLDRILLKIYLPGNFEYIMSQIGIYGANYKIAILMTLFIQMFRYAADPFIYSNAKEKDADESYSKVMNYFIISGLFIFLSVMLYIDIIKYFIGESYHSGLKIVPVILLANLFLGIIYNLSIWYKLTNKTMYGAYLAIFGAFITITLNIILIPKIGYMGSAWATLACYFSMMILSYLLSRKHFKVKYDLKTIIFYFILTGIIYFTYKQIPFTNKLYQFSTAGILLIIYLFVTYFISIKNKIHTLG